MNKSAIHFALALAFGGGMAVDARAGECWVDVFAQTQYKGQRQRILGPAALPGLKAVNGEDWSNRIDSLIVGPGARLWLYRKENFQGGASLPPNHPDALKAWGESGASRDDQEVSFGPGQKEHHLGEMNFHHNTNSLRIECGKPR